MSRLAAIGLGLGVTLGCLAACGNHGGGGSGLPGGGLSGSGLSGSGLSGGQSALPGGGGSARSSRSSGGQPSVGLLATVPATPGNLRTVVLDDPAWLSDPTLMGKQWCNPTKGTASQKRFELLNALPDGSPLGYELIVQSFLGRKPLGYLPSAATEELTIGDLPHEMTVVRVPIGPATDAALKKAGFHRGAATDGHPTFHAGPLDLRHITPIKTVLQTIKTVELSSVLIAGGGTGIAPGALAAALDDHRAAHPLSADPAVTALTTALGGGPDASADNPAEMMGTSILDSPLIGAVGAKATPQQITNLLHRDGLSKLKIPATLAGFRYVTGGRPNCQVAAAAVYPTPGAAKTAAAVLGPVLRHGTSLATDDHYNALWTVRSITTHGDAVVARLTLRSPQNLAEALVRNDFPLFWTPPIVAKS